MKKKLLDYLSKMSNYIYLITVLRWEMDTIAPKKSLDYLINNITFLEGELLKLETSDEYINIINNLT